MSLIELSWTAKKQFKVQIIGILEKIDSYNWPKMHLWKVDKKFGQGPPSFGQNPKEQQLFFRETFPYLSQSFHSKQLIAFILPGPLWWHSRGTEEETQWWGDRRAVLSKGRKVQDLHRKLKQFEVWIFIVWMITDVEKWNWQNKRTAFQWSLY